jgi:PEP-CTERM motif
MIPRNRLMASLMGCVIAGEFLLSGRAIAGPVSYELRVCEDAYFTLDPTNAQFAEHAASLTQQELFSMRDMPYMQLMNTSPTADAQIVRFSITIGDLFNNSQHFDWVKMIDYSPGITWQLVMPDTANGSVRSDAIDIIFAGFTPGKLVRFQTDIDNDQGDIDIFTDYRQVLFDLGGNNANDNSLVTVQFEQPGLPRAVSSDHLPDFAQLGPTNLGFRLISECGPESVNAYISSGNAEVVPEPATWAMLACGLGMAVAITARKSPKRQWNCPLN